MNCFQINIFEISNTALPQKNKKYNCCELLSNKYLWNIKYSYLQGKESTWRVVNCFQINIFEISNTAYYRYRNIASRCELLSNKYLWNIKYSSTADSTRQEQVVNCFQINIFEISNTAQQYAVGVDFCCELLSNKYLWNIKYSSPSRNFKQRAVVNCFQINIFEISNTASIVSKPTRASCELLSNKYLWNIKYSGLFVRC